MDNFAKRGGHAIRAWVRDDVTAEDDAATARLDRCSRHQQRIARVVLGRAAEHKHRHVAGFSHLAVRRDWADIMDLDEVGAGLGADPRGFRDILYCVSPGLLERYR